MSLSVLTTPSALVSLGLSAGDVATIISLGSRFGNWWTSQAGDKSLLKDLDIDETTIFKRQGLLDLPSFNKCWRKQIRLLANNRPLEVAESEISKVLGDVKDLLGDLSLFTAVFVCITAVLDRFTDSNTVQFIVFSLLRDLIGAAEIGEDMLRAQLNSRWLLGTREDTFHTSSSDVAGIAACLFHLGLDVIYVQGPGFGTNDEVKACTVVYSKTILNPTMPSRLLQAKAVLSRAQVTTVPIAEPQEAVGVFPATTEENDQYRRAWNSGKRSAESVNVGVYAVDPAAQMYPETYMDLMYAFVNQGRQIQHTKTEISDLAHHHAMVVNDEVIQGLEDCLRWVDNATLRWIDDQTSSRESTDCISEPTMTDSVKIVAFTTFQSFFMGYYYGLFFPLVDTSTLVLQTVDGAWGFRSPALLRHMRTAIVNPSPISSSQMTVSKRQQLIPVLAGLFLKTTLDIPLIMATGERSKNECMGIIRDRTLVANSLLGKCRTPQEVGKFTLLDVDVGGIPRDHNGLIRPGLALPLDNPIMLQIPGPDILPIFETGPEEDVTFNIEADWEADPSTALVCVRYKGRRLVCISPARTDLTFCASYQPPESPFRARSSLEKGVAVGIESLLGDNPSLCLIEKDGGVAVLFQALGQPCLRYTALALYSGTAPTYLVSDCVRSAADLARSRAETNVMSQAGPVLIAGIRVASSDDHDSRRHVDPKSNQRVWLLK